MDLRQLRVLVELADRGTLRAVAAATGYGTSAVSQQLAGLEKTVGSALAEPDGRRLRLTAAGRAFLPHARRILTEMGAARTALAADHPQGTVRVAAYSSALEADVVEVAVRLRETHPGLRIELYEREPPETIRLLRAGRAELGLVYEYSLVPRTPPPMIVTEMLCEVPMLLALPAGSASGHRSSGHSASGHRSSGHSASGHSSSGHDDASAHPVPTGLPTGIARAEDLRVLAGASWIVNSRADDDEELVRRFTALAGFAPDVTHGVDSLDVVQRLVAAGLGIALVPAVVRPHPGTRLVPITLVPLARRMIAATRAGEETWPATALVQRLIGEHARGEHA
ncbi:LysR family transcriptional regulator [Hamadaea tsunoensis]|nr:LysR substrate-binding domain-containing protein [Hamadaea tsunoensis]